MNKGRITKLKSYKDKVFTKGRGIKWMIADEQGNSVYCDKCGNIANAVMRVTRNIGVFMIPLCKSHLVELFPDVEYCPIIVDLEPTKKLTITESLIKDFGFEPVANFKKDPDWDLFTCYKRIHIAHYVYYSEEHKHFTLVYKFDKPKGQAGGGFVDRTSVMIPKVIYSIKDAKKLLESIL